MQTDPAAAPSARPSAHAGATRWLILAGVWFCYACFGLVATSLAPLVPVIVEDLGIGHGAMGSIMGAWQLVYIFAAVPCGLLLDRLGARHAIALGGLDRGRLWPVARALLLAGGVGQTFVAHYFLTASEATLYGLRIRAFEHVHRLSIAEHSESRRGVIVARVTSDVEQLAK